MPPLLHRRIVGERRHRRSVDTGRERAEDVLHIVSIPTAPAEVPAFMPIGWLDRESPVVFQVEGVAVAAPVRAMAFDALLFNDELGALLNALFAV